MRRVPGKSPIRNAGAASADTPSVSANAAAIIASDRRGIGSVPSHRNSIEVRTMPTTPMASSTASDAGHRPEAFAADDHARVGLVEIGRRQHPREALDAFRQHRERHRRARQEHQREEQQVRDRRRGPDVARRAADEQANRHQRARAAQVDGRPAPATSRPSACRTSGGQDHQHDQRQQPGHDRGDAVRDRHRRRRAPA